MDKKRLKQTIKNGSFLGLLIEKIDYYCMHFLSKNKNAAIYIKQCKTYHKFKKKYANLIGEGVSDKEEIKSNKVWFCWLQGYDEAPEIVKACYNSIEKNFLDKEIIFLSSENIFDYISLPEYIIEKYEKGIIGRANYSDLVRIALLTKYGGTWVDSTVLCTSSEVASYITSHDLFVFKQFDLVHADENPIVSSNWLISAKTNNKILRLTQKLLFEYWKKEKYLKDYFIFHLFFSLSCLRYREEFNKIPAFNNHSPHTMLFELGSVYEADRWKELLSISGIHKLSHHLSFQRDNTFYNHIVDEYLTEYK